MSGQSGNGSVAENFDPAVSHDQFIKIMDDPGEGVRLDTARCLGMLNDGALGRIPFIVATFVGWGFHLVCWAGLIYLFTRSWLYGGLGILGYLVLFFVKTVVVEHWVAANLTLAKAKNDPDFYRKLCADDILEAG